MASFGFAGGLAEGLGSGIQLGQRERLLQKQNQSQQQSLLFKQSQQALKVAKDIADNATSYVGNIPDRNSLNMDVQNHSIAQLNDLAQMFAARGDNQTAQDILSYVNPIKSAKTQGEISQEKALQKAKEKLAEGNAEYDTLYPGAPAPATNDLASPQSGVPGINSPAGASANGSTAVTTNPNGAYFPDQANPIGSTSGQVAQADQPQVPTRQEFLQRHFGGKGADSTEYNITAADKNTVQAILEGRQPPPTANRSPRNIAILNQVYDADPNYTPQRNQIFKDYTTGKPSETARAINQASYHALEMEKSFDKLGNYGITALNVARNYFRKQGGNNPVKAFDDAKLAFSSELRRAWAGTGGSLEELKQWEDALDAADTPKTFKSVMSQISSLLLGAVQANRDKYAAVMGRETPFISDDAQAALSHFIDGTPAPTPGQTVANKNGNVVNYTDYFKASQ